MIRLLYSGVSAQEGRETRLSAEPFSQKQLASSALWAGLGALLPHAEQSTPPPAFPFIECSAPDSPFSLASSAPVYLCGPATSSMDVARTLAAAGQLPVWGSVLARSQTSGRGQLGRNWVSPEGNIYAALRIPYTSPFTTTAAAPALGGLLADALGAVGISVWVKWPNDLVQGPDEGAQAWCKVGGILLEERPFLPAQCEREKAPAMLIAGIGLNITSCPPDSLLRKEKALPAGSLIHPKTSTLSLVPFWIQLVRQILFCYANEMQSRGENSWQNLTERRLAFLGQPVLLVDGSKEQEQYNGILEGLDSSGGLRLRGCNGVSSSFLSGSLQMVGSRTVAS